MRTLIIVPAYNEQANIETVINNLIENYSQYDYVVVNDGSSDDTSAICKQHGYNLIDLPVNLGLSGAFQTGMKYAFLHKYDAAIQFDADGQHRAEYIAAMETKMQEGFDIVIGSRYLTQKKPLALRMLGSRLISCSILLTTFKRLTDPTSGMRLYNAKIIDQLAKNINCAPEPDTISYLMKCGAKVSEIQVMMDERVAGESYLNFTRSIAYMLRISLSILIVQWFRRGNLTTKEPK